MGPNVCFECDTIQYIALNSIPFQPSPNVTAENSPVTVIAVEGVCPINGVWLDRCLAELEKCDVYRTRHFMNGLVVTNIKAGQSISTGFHARLRDLGNRWLDLRYDKGLKEELLPGPYLYLDNALRPVYRLYEDRQRAFLTALKPKPHWPCDASFSQLRIAGTLYDRLAIAVPPRSPENTVGAQCRLRIAVKDLYRVKGLKTSLSYLS
ncbi:hypothetical protein F5Y08DRAFT_47524 [Xylaria arbuscula]|nr:hypothetical protein F5Y08DRAFT_47524 [Xylaria arbuscula]